MQNRTLKKIKLKVSAPGLGCIGRSYGFGLGISSEVKCRVKNAIKFGEDY